MTIVISTAAALAETPIGTTFIDVTNEIVVKTGPAEYAMAADLGNGEVWAYLDHSEIIGAYLSEDLSVNAEDELHVPWSKFLPMTVHRLGGDRDGSVTEAQSFTHHADGSE